jgi:hypothetical protein
MLIKTEAKREGGSLHEVGGTEYLFKPIAKGADHVCEVENPGHIQRFLGIPGFTIYDPNAKPAPVEPVAPVAPAATTEPVEPSYAGVEPAAPVEPAPVDVEPRPVPLEDLTRDELAEIYQDVIGTPAHHRATKATLIERIREAAAEKAEA